MSSRHFARGSAAGNIITLLLLVGIVGLGAWLWLGKKEEPKTGRRSAEPAQRSRRKPTAALPNPRATRPSPIEPVTGTPTLEAANTFVPKDNMLRIDISEYAGYGGLIVANGGLEPNADSFFAKEYGFKVAISMSESETWGPLNNGQLAATATTADALAVLGRQFDAIVPMQLGYSRGADMVVVDRGIASVNALEGKTLAASQFNESEFFIRYLAQEAGVPVIVLRDLDSKPDGRLARPGVLRGCVRRLRRLSARTRQWWRPAQWLRGLDAEDRRGDRGQQGRRQGAGVEPQPAGHRRRARREQGLRQGSSGNGEGPGARHSRRQPPSARQPGREHRRGGQGVQVERGRRARRTRARASVQRAGESRVLRRHHRLRRFVRRHLPVFGARVRQRDQESGRSGAFRRLEFPRRDRQAQPVLRAEDRHRARSARRRRPRSRAIRCSARTSASSSSPTPRTSIAMRRRTRNTCRPSSVSCRSSPGSTVLLRGHVDNARVNEFRQSGGEQLVQSMALKAMELSRQRAMAVSDALLAKFPEIDKARVEVRGPRLGRTHRRHRQRAEPARRGAVVHDRINGVRPRFLGNGA